MFDIQVALAFIPLGFLGTHTIIEKINEEGEDYGSKYYDVNFYDDNSKQIEQNGNSEMQQEEPSEQKPYLSIYIYDIGYLYISYVDSNNISRLSGNDIINMVIDYSKNNNFIILSLDDQSSIKVNVQGEEYNLDLAGLTILSSGISWYNKLGFKQKEYDTQLLHWKEIRKSTLNQLGDLILNLDGEKIKNKNYFNTPFQILGLDEENDFQTNMSITLEYLFSKQEYVDCEIGKVSSMIQNNIRFFTYGDPELLLYHITFISTCALLLDYDRILYMDL